MMLVNLLELVLLLLKLLLLRLLQIGKERRTHATFTQQSAKAQEYAVEELETAMESMDLETTEGQEKMEDRTS